MQRRRLPHQYPEGRALFLTWHLHGSVPASRFPTPRKLSAGESFRLDRSLPGHHPHRAALAQARRDRPPGGRSGSPFGPRVESLRRGGLRRHGQPCPPARLAAGPGLAISAFTERLYGKGGEQDPRSDRTALLAKGILRPLGAGFGRTRAHPPLHRAKPRQSRARVSSARLPLVERKRSPGICFTDVAPTIRVTPLTGPLDVARASACRVATRGDIGFKGPGRPSSP